MKRIVTSFVLLLVCSASVFAGDRWGGPVVDGKDHEYICKVHVSTWDHKIVRVLAKSMYEAEQRAQQLLGVNNVLSIQCTQQDNYSR